MVNSIKYLKNHSSPKLHFLQINLNHCKNAMVELNNIINRQDIDIILIQEPYIFRNRIQNFSNRSWVVELNLVNEHARAAILHKKELDCFILNEFCTRDMSTVLLNINNRKTIVSSIYIDNHTLEILNKMKDLLELARTKQYQVIIGGDFNAHSEFWGSSNPNSRGDEIAEFLSKMNLDIVNKGCKPTFKRVNCETIIDVTVATRFISNKISEWKVLSDCTGSYHKYITFKVECKE